jgi:hypothetical protein
MGILELLEYRQITLGADNKVPKWLILAMRVEALA